MPTRCDLYWINQRLAYTLLFRKYSMDLLQQKSIKHTHKLNKVYKYLTNWYLRNLLAINHWKITTTKFNCSHRKNQSAYKLNLLWTCFWNVSIRSFRFFSESSIIYKVIKYLFSFNARAKIYLHYCNLSEL